MSTGFDSVKLSTRNMYTIYYEWRASGAKRNFKEYLLEKDDRIKDFANSFIRFNSGDMFTRESVVELEDGRLLCFDPDEFKKAYVIDFSNITKDDINFDRDTDFAMIKADSTKKGYETRNSAIISYLGNDIKTKDGLTLESYLSTASLDEPESTQINPNSTNLFYYNNISQMSNDEEEKEYYRNIITSLGGQVDTSGRITTKTDPKTDTALSKLNEKIRLFKKYIERNDTQSKLNALVLLQQLGLSELELIEKLSPGFLEQIGAFTAGYEGVSYTDNNGFQSSLSQVISFEKVMTYKYNNSDKYWMYLSLEDRKYIFENKLQDSTPTDPIGKAAKALTSSSSATSESIKTTMAENLENHISATTIKNYKDEFTKCFSQDGKNLASGHTYDEALEYLTMLCTENVSGEILYTILQDSLVQQCLITLGTQKGTLPTAKTADKPANEQLTVQLVYSAMIAKINAFAQDAYTVIGDKERIEAQKVVNSTISFLDAAAGGTNVTYNEHEGWFFVGSLAAYPVMQAGWAAWAHYEANSIVEKTTTQLLHNAEYAAWSSEDWQNAHRLLETAEKAKGTYNKDVLKIAQNYSDEYSGINKVLYDNYKDIDKFFQGIPTDDANEIKIAISRLKLHDDSCYQKDYELLLKHKDTLRQNGLDCDKFLDAWKKFKDLPTDIDSNKLIEAAEAEKAAEDAANEAADKVAKNAEKTQKFRDAADNIDKMKEAAKKAEKAKNAAEKLEDAAKDAAEKAQKAAEKAKDAADKAKDAKEAADKAKDAKDAAEKAKKAKEAAKKAKKAEEAAKKADNKLKKIVQELIDDGATDDIVQYFQNTGATISNNPSADDIVTALKGKDKGFFEDLTKKIGATAETKKKAFENATKFRNTTRQGVVDNLNDNLSVKRHSKNGVGEGKKFGWGNKKDDVAEAVAKSLDFDNAGNVAVRQAADGSDDLAKGVTRKVLKEGAEDATEKAGKDAAKKAGKDAAKKATTATKALRLGGVLSKMFMAVDCVSSAIDGGTMGYGIASYAVENNPDNFVNADGSYDKTRARVAKGFGAAAGTCFGFAAGMLTSGTGAAINAASAGLGTAIGIAAAAVGVVCAGISAIACFTKWFK